MVLKRLAISFGLAGALLCPFAPRSSAAAINIPNSSFEVPLAAIHSVDPVLGDYDQSFSDPKSAWQYISGGANAGLYAPNIGPQSSPKVEVYYNLPPTQGATQKQIAYIDYGIVQQILVDTFQPGLIYTLSFYQGQRLEKDQEPTYSFSLGVVNAGQFIPINTQVIQGYLLQGQNPSAPAPSGSFQQFSSVTNSDDPTLGGYYGKQIAIRFNNMGSIQGGLAQLDIDNVALDASSNTPLDPLASPEPASLGLMGAGLVAAAVARKRLAAVR